MTHHRCTRCKQEADIRHKYYGGLFCDSCIRKIRGFTPSSSRGWLGSLWDKIVEFASDVFHHRKTVRLVSKETERAVHSRFKVMQSRARGIPSNPQTEMPQKR